MATITVAAISSAKPVATLKAPESLLSFPLFKVDVDNVLYHAYGTTLEAHFL